MKMEDLKLEGLKQPAKQLVVDFHVEKNMSKTELIDLMDPMIRSIDTKTYLVVDKELMQMDKTTVDTDNQRDKIKEICRKELRAHDISSDCIETSDDLDEAIERCYYLDRTLVSKRTLTIFLRAKF